MSRFFLALLIFFLGLLFAWRLTFAKPRSLPNQGPVKFITTLKDEPRIYDRQVIRIDNLKIYTDLYPRYKIGDKLEIEGKLDNKNRIYNPKITHLGRSLSFAAKIADFRANISANISSYLPSYEAALVTGTVLGIDNIPTQFREQLIKTGTIHVVVVSGQNLTIVAGIFISLAKYIGRRKAIFLATLAAISYAILTGFEPPVIRASIMVLISSLAIYFGRQNLSLLSLVLAALIIFLIWPQAISDISFQLTFAATLGIITLGQFFARSWSKYPYLGQNAAIATSAYIFTAPLIIYHFGQTSLISPITNILVAEAVFPLMILGFAAAIASLILTPIAQLFAYFAYVPALYFVKVVEIFERVNVGQVNVATENLLFVILSYLIILLICVVWNYRSEAKNVTMTSIKSHKQKSLPTQPKKRSDLDTG